MSSIPFVSYSQNGEDVLLWRALKDVERGFYIDVGAQDPVSFSITKAFYERGWHGINIEPVQHWHDLLLRDRPHDVNLRVAAGNRPGTINLFEVEDTGLSTASAEFAHRHAAGGFKVHERVVDCTTLDRICADNNVGTVHFLKIDCEGSEKSVLEGTSLIDVRPWIILVESTEPLSTKETWQQWEHLLTGRGYKFVFFDGLNRFYVAEEHIELAAAFDAPVNVFDDVQRISDINAQTRIDRLTREIESLNGAATNANLQAKLDAIGDEREQLQHRLDAVDQERQQLQHRLDAAGLDRQQLQHRLDAAAREQQQLQHRLDATGLEREQLRRRMDAGRVECAQLLLRIDVLTIERDQLRLWQQGLHREAGAFRMEASRLQANQAALLSSHSWRITAPLRACSRALRRVRHGLGRAAYLALRPFAHAARPMLRRLVKNPRVRRLAIGIFGEDAAIVEQSRLFLFGAAPPVSGAADDHHQTPDGNHGENLGSTKGDQATEVAGSLAQIDRLIDATVQKTRLMSEQQEGSPQDSDAASFALSGNTVQGNSERNRPAIDPVEFKRAVAAIVGTQGAAERGSSDRPRAPVLPNDTP